MGTIKPTKSREALNAKKKRENRETNHDLQKQKMREKEEKWRGCRFILASDEAHKALLWSARLKEKRPKTPT